MNNFIIQAISKKLPHSILIKLGIDKKMKRKLSCKSACADEVLLSKFEATLLGALIGDCIGKRFEGIWGPNMGEMLDDFKLLKERMNELDDSESSCDESYNIFINDNLKKYTDDTALTRAVCDSLLNKGELDVVDMALSLQQTYFKEPNRGYTSGAINIFKKFHKLKSTNQLADCCFWPAMELFNGEGSFGNGGGMRCSPIALYTFALTLDEMKVICELSTKLTHTHIWGLVGALQQCYAIRLALLSTKSAHSFDFDNYFMDILHFVCECEKSFRQSDEETKESGARYANKCIQKNFSLYMEQKESYKENFDHLTANHNGENRCEKTYSTVLKKLYKLINKCRKGERINLNLLYKKVAGCGISAIESIPMALFAFIIASDPKCSNELNSKLNSKNAFKEYDAVERVILYAISFGGECSNKIASMAGAIAGAFFSKAEIPKYLIEMCESHRDVKDYAQKLFNSAWSSGKESNGNKDCKQSPVD